MWRRDRFDRSRFLLRLLATVIGLQVGLFGAGGIACIWIGLQKQERVCPDFPRDLRQMFETATATVLGVISGAGLRRD